MIEIKGKKHTIENTPEINQKRAAKNLVSMLEDVETFHVNGEL